MTGRIDATVTFNLTVHDQRALRRAAWARAKELGIDVWDHARWRRQVGGVEADLLTLLDDGTSPPGCAIENTGATLYHLEKVP
jgi:hypothetical protein